MTTKDAKALLIKIAEQKLPAFTGLAGLLPGAAAPDVAAHAKQTAKKDLLHALLVSAGLGIAIRGASGLNTLPRKRKTTGRTIELPVAYPVKQSAASQPTHPFGVRNFIPSILLGTPLAFYGGWKGIDAILENRRKQNAAQELEAAKEEYEKALLGAHANKSATALDKTYTKLAGLSDLLSFSTAPEALRGLALSYAIPATGLAYYTVDKAMKKNSKRELLQRAAEERARRQALLQPPAIYAVPSPVNDEE